MSISGQTKLRDESMGSPSYYIPRIWPCLPIGSKFICKEPKKPVNTDHSTQWHQSILQLMTPSNKMATTRPISWNCDAVTAPQGNTLQAVPNLKILKHLCKPHICSLSPTLREKNDEKHNDPKSTFPTRVTNWSPQSGKTSSTEQLRKKGVSHVHFSVLFPLSSAQILIPLISSLISELATSVLRASSLAEAQSSPAWQAETARPYSRELSFS